jgi:hypothetical protein
MFTSLTNGGILFTAAFDLAFAAVETCCLFGAAHACFFVVHELEVL